jgi:hypothetical protein
MKLKTLIALCKRDGVFRLYDRPNEDGEVTEQWLGTGGAVYPLPAGISYLTEESICGLFDITEKQQENIFFSHNPLPEGYSFEHAAAGEIMLDREKMTLGYGGRTVRPIITSGGLEFIDVDFLTPLADVADDLELYERRTADGGTYFAAKMGLMIVGVIMPLNIIEDKLVESVETLAGRLRDALAEKNARKSARLAVQDDQTELDGEE